MKKEDLREQIKQLEKDKEKLLVEIRILKKKSKGKIGYVLLILGTILFALAIYSNHSVSAFIGVALTFWGALFIYITPTRFIKKEILDTTIDSLENYHRLTEELGYEGTPQYISPSTVWGLRNTVLYIPKIENMPKPTNEELSAESILIDNPKAMKLIPPGQSLSRLIEDELKINFSTVDFEYLQYNLKKAFVEGLEIAESFQMELRDTIVHVEIKGSIFYKSILAQIESKKLQRIHDPLNSSIACILARSTKKPIVIENIQIEPRERMINSYFKLL